MTPWRRRLRKLRFFLQATFVTLVITAAVLVGFAQLALPWLAENPQRIEGWLSERLGRTVSIGHVEGAWSRAGPRLVLDQMQIAEGTNGEPSLTVPRAELALNLYAAFQRNRAWNEFRLVGLDLGLVRRTEGDWQLRGIDAGSGEGGSMGALGAVVLVDLKLSVIDAQRDLKLNLRVPELRVVNLGRITRVLGQVGSENAGASPLWLVADIDTGNRAGQLYIGGNMLDLAELAAGHAIGGIRIVASSGDFELWSNWQQGRVKDVWLKLALGPTVLEATSEVAVGPELSVLPRSGFDELGLSAHWHRNGQGWKLDLADTAVMRQGISSAPGRLVVERMDGEASRFQVAANALDLGTAGNLAMLSASVPDKLRQWLYLGNPRGTLGAVELRWNSAEDFDVDALVDGFACRSAGAIPGIDSLSARLTGDAGSVLLAVPTQATRIDYPKAFRKPFELTRFGGDVLAWRDDGDWRLQTAQLKVDAPNYAIDLRGGVEIQSDGSRPVLDLSALVSQAEVEASKLFWPVNTMPPATIEWLDRALVSGTVTSGRAVVRGDLDNWPFDDNAGRFEARADLEDLQLDYLPDWPSGEKLDVVAHFINNGMQATARSGKSRAVSIDGAEATIASFRDPLLVLTADAQAAGVDLLDYLRATPVGERHATYLDGLRIGGRGNAHIMFNVPLKENENATLDGRVDLVNADLDESTWDLHFRKANGQVRFNRSGVSAESLATSYENHPVTLGVAIGSSARDPLNAFEATLDGVLPAAVVFARATDLAPAMAGFPGQANWQIGLAIGSEDGAAAGRKTLRLQSDLDGIAFDLPAPLDKPADVARAFDLSLQMPPAGQPFTASLGQILQVRGNLPGPTTSLAARLDLGPVASTEEVPASGIYIGGHAAAIDVDGWIRLFSAGGTGGDLLQGMALDVDEMQLAGRSFPALHVDLMPARDTTTIRVQGESLEGELSVPGVDLRRRGITAQMQRVHWPDLPAGKVDGPTPLSGIAPATLPPLHLWVGELQFGSSKFGDMRLESYPTDRGMRIDLLESKSVNVDMRASGDWNGSAADNHSQLVIDMTAKSLGSMLDAFGYAGIIEGGQTFARIDASWPGSPTAFALANTEGTLEIGVEKGRILDVDPGASGRLFGLLSLREIPRRLSLDFSDLFKSGMSFNSIKGSFALGDGNATTHDLLINSPAADISISGRTGLRSKDYDQEMVVTPRAGVALPVVGALAGGPVGAAAGIVVQTLIGKRLNRAARSRYRVTGSWEKPVIVLIGKENVKTGSTPDPDAALPAPAESGTGDAGKDIAADAATPASAETSADAASKSSVPVSPEQPDPTADKPTSGSPETSAQPVVTDPEPDPPRH